MNDLTTNDIAGELGTTPRNLRKFLRSPSSPYQPVGQGSRYNISSTDLADLKKLFETWVSRPGSRATSTEATPSTSTRRSPKRPKTKIVDKVDPLEEDDLMFRLTHTVADRQRHHGVICNYSWSHPKVRGLDEKCSGLTVKGTRFCPIHQQVTYCGDMEPVDGLCGPGGRHPKPYCQYHNGDLSEAEFDELVTLPPEQWN